MYIPFIGYRRRGYDGSGVGEYISAFLHRQIILTYQRLAIISIDCKVTDCQSVLFKVILLSLLYISFVSHTFVPCMYRYGFVSVFEVLISKDNARLGRSDTR